MNEQEAVDVLIIGSGVAGTLCAYRLAQNGLRVVVMEAGPAIKREDIVQGFLTSPQHDLSAGFPNAPWAPRPDWQTPAENFIQHKGSARPSMEYLRVLGGTTWHWGGTALRLLPSEFRTHAEFGIGVDWPINYDVLEPYYLQAEIEMGVAGDALSGAEPVRSGAFPLDKMPVSYAEQEISNALKSIGINFVSRPVARNSKPYDGRPQCQGHSSCSPICPIGAQYSAQTHIDKAIKLGVTFSTNTRVDRLQAGLNGDIESVHFSNNKGIAGKVRASIIVLAANGIETPRLLLMSTSEQYPKGLANRSIMVGRHYMDHPGITCTLTLPKPIYAGRGPESTLICHDFRTGKQKSRRAAWTLGITNRIRLHDIAREALQENFLPSSLDAVIRNKAQHQIEFDLQFEQLPDPDSRIALNWNRRDSAGQPGMDFYYEYGAYERAGFEEGKKLLKKISKHLGASDCSISEPNSRHHLMGATRMGNEASTSVVNAECQSHDHENLFILGSAVFPTAGTANPTLTIAALSLRAADSIHAKLRNAV